MPEELSPRRRQAILMICCLSLFIVGLDNTIVNVALPSIRTSLHASPSGLQWTIDAYTLVLASLLMLSGSTADRVGRKRIFQLGLVLFTTGSLACSLAPNLGSLVAFRALQAIGGSMLNPVAMSIITNTFTDPRERARAIGVWGGVVGFSLALGPVIGGALVDAIGWRSIFWINIPVGLAAWLLTRAYVPESRAAHARRLDPTGQVLIMVTLATLVGAIIEGPQHGWGSPLILALFGVALVAGIAMVLWELQREEPLIDVRFFRSAPFAGATLIAICAFAALSGLLFLNTQYLQEVRGFSALKAGLYTLPLAGVTIFFAPLSGRVVGRGRAHCGRRDPHRAVQRDAVVAAVARLPGLRARVRGRQRTDHQLRCRRNAPGASGRRRRRRVDEPPGRPVAGRRHPRVHRAGTDPRPDQDRLRPRVARRLGSDHGAGPGGAAARCPHLQPVGEAHGQRDRRAPGDRGGEP